MVSAFKDSWLSCSLDMHAFVQVWHLVMTDQKSIFWGPPQKVRTMGRIRRIFGSILERKII